MKKCICLSIVGLLLFCSLGLADLVDNGDGTVTDTATGLTWQQAEAGDMNWEEALGYCENLDLAGHDDWRLPNVNELQTIVDYGQYNPSTNTAFFPNTTSLSYWSSTTNADDADQAWNVNFYGGRFYENGKVNSFYVRAVRGGQ